MKVEFYGGPWDGYRLDLDVENITTTYTLTDINSKVTSIYRLNGPRSNVLRSDGVITRVRFEYQGVFAKSAR